jgi:hypothetical protein
LVNDAHALASLIDGAEVTAAMLRSGSADAPPDVLKSAINGIELQSYEINTTLALRNVLAALGTRADIDVDHSPLVLTCAALKVRRGIRCGW